MGTVKDLETELEFARPEERQMTASGGKVTKSVGLAEASPSIWTVLGWIGATAVVVAGATWTVAVATYSQRIENLQEDLNEARAEAVLTGGTVALGDGFPPIGTEVTVTAVPELSVVAAWKGHHKPMKQVTATYMPPPGWVIVVYEIHEGSCNNCTHSVDLIAGGAQFASEEEVKEVYKSAIEVAIKAGNKELEAKLKSEMENHVKLVREIKANTNTLFAKVSAEPHGGPLNRKRGWAHLSIIARLRYYGATGDDIAASLEEAHGIVIPPKEEPETAYYAQPTENPR